MRVPMKKWLIILLCAGVGYYLYTNRPLRETHQAVLYLAATGETANEDTMAMEQWQKLRFRDFLIATTLSDTDQFNLVSYGYFNRVNIVDKEWTGRAFGLLPPLDRSPH